MTALARSIRFDLRKTLGTQKFWIVAAILVFAQPLLALLESTQIAQIGLDATPESHPELADALPPLALMGFDVMPFGEVAIVVLGALLGASEYDNGELRTTFLGINRRRTALAGKMLSTLAVVALLSSMGAYLTLVLTHWGLGSYGLNPLTLAPKTWHALGWLIGSWTAIAMMAWAVAVATKNWLVAMLVMVPQVVGLGGMLASTWAPARLLPVAAGHCLSEVPGATCSSRAAAGAALAVETAALVIVSGILFIRRDVGARG